MMKLFATALAMAFAVTAHGASDSSEWFFVDTTDKPKPPTLSAESADWTDGTITLRCEDADLNGADVPFYNLMYYDTAEEKWRVIDRYDLTIPTPVEETNSSGGKSIVTKITDKNFSKRNNGIGTVRYRVVDEADAERMAGCETRKRHGLFVAVGEYEDPGLKPLSMVSLPTLTEPVLPPSSVSEAAGDLDSAWNPLSSGQLHTIPMRREYIHLL